MYYSLIVPSPLYHMYFKDQKVNFSIVEFLILFKFQYLEKLDSLGVERPHKAIFLLSSNHHSHQSHDDHQNQHNTHIIHQKAWEAGSHALSCAAWALYGGTQK